MKKGIVFLWLLYLCFPGYTRAEGFPSAAARGLQQAEDSVAHRDVAPVKAYATPSPADPDATAAGKSAKRAEKPQKKTGVLTKKAEKPEKSEKPGETAKTPPKPTPDTPKTKTTERKSSGRKTTGTAPLRKKAGIPDKAPKMPAATTKAPIPTPSTTPVAANTTTAPATTPVAATSAAFAPVPARSGVFSSGTAHEPRNKKKTREHKQPLPELSADSIRILKKQRGLTSFANVFVPQGQWVTGINASFSTHSNNNYTFVVIEGINSAGHTLKIAPILAYAFRNNMVIGARFTYSRTYLSVDSGNIQLGDDDTGVELKVDSYYSLKHAYEAALIWRQYIPLGQNKRFALFNEMQLGMGSSQAKFAADTPVRGTYETGKHISIGLTPGLVAFATNNMALELNIGVMGFNYSTVRQVHNQVTVGTRKSSSMNFKVNIFSIGLGVAFYL